jgi:tRNA pseudouridine38-40 synthase
MPRFAFRIEYHGRGFAGWQRQDNLPTVQGAIEAALARLDPAGPAVAGAGRTDAGVHATGQVAHADLSRDWDPFRLGEALNAHLRPHAVAILACARVADDWHARFSATERAYCYRILCRRAPLALDAGLAWRVGHPLDPDLMRAGAAHLVGRHDFTTFRSTLCQARSPVKSVDAIAIDAAPCPGGTQITIRVRARSFLHNQIRSFVGTLERVGAGAWAPGDVARARDARDRRACGPVAPPEGLCLTDVVYPADPFA